MNWKVVSEIEVGRKECNQRNKIFFVTWDGKEWCQIDEMVWKQENWEEDVCIVGKLKFSPWGEEWKKTEQWTINNFLCEEKERGRSSAVNELKFSLWKRIM